MLPIKVLQQVPGRVRMALTQSELDELRQHIRAEVRDEMLQELKRDFLAEMPEAPQLVQEICASVDRWASLKIAEEANKALDEEAEEDPSNRRGHSPRFADADALGGAGEPEEQHPPISTMSLRGMPRDELVKLNAGATAGGDKLIRMSCEAAIKEIDETAQADKIVDRMFGRKQGVA